MKLTGIFTMISVESRESNGKWYHNVNMESEDGRLLRIGVEQDVMGKLKKYEKHNGYFEVGSFTGKDGKPQMYMRLVDAEPLVAGK